MTISENSLLIILSEERLRNIITDSLRQVLSEIPQAKKSASDADTLLTREEAAKEWKVCVSTIDNYKNRGLIVPLRLGNTLRYKRGDLIQAFSGSILGKRKNPYKGE